MGVLDLDLVHFGPILGVQRLYLNQFGGSGPGFGQFSAYFGVSCHISDSFKGSGPGFGSFLDLLQGVYAWVWSTFGLFLAIYLDCFRHILRAMGLYNGHLMHEFV